MFNSVKHSLKSALLQLKWFNSKDQNLISANRNRGFFSGRLLWDKRSTFLIGVQSPAVPALDVFFSFKLYRNKRFYSQCSQNKGKASSNVKVHIQLKPFGISKWVGVSSNSRFFLTHSSLRARHMLHSS